MSLYFYVNVHMYKEDYMSKINSMNGTKVHACNDVYEITMEDVKHISKPSWQFGYH